MVELILFGGNLPNLIFEGIDRIGKTTIIDALDDGTYSRIKMNAPDSLSKTYYEYLKYFDKLSQRRVRDLIYDRGHLSEWVYGSLYRRTWHNADNKLLPKWIRNMERHLIRCQNDYHVGPTIIVYVEPYRFDIMQEDDRPNANRHREVAAYEHALYHLTELPIVRIRTQDDSGWRPIDEIVLDLKEKLKHV